MRINIINEHNAYDYVWRRLQQYHDIERTTDLIISRFNYDPKHKKNIKKKAEQISVCLMQAYEFSKSAQISSIATKGLQAYYSLTALINIQILWFGDYKVDLDNRDSRYSSHGLILTAADNIYDYRACIKDTVSPNGLFGLWLRFAQHSCGYGTEVKMTNDYKATRTAELFSPHAHVSTNLNFHSYSLLTCLKRAPGLLTSLSNYDGSDLTKASFEKIRTTTKNKNTLDSRFIIQTTNNDSKILNSIQIPPEQINDYNIAQDNGATFIRHSIDFNDESNHNFQYNKITTSMEFPIGMAYRSKEMLLCPESNLNELGYYYIGSYIIGMLSRYHPHTWGKDAKDKKALSFIIDEYIDSILTIVPLRILDSMEDTVTVFH